MAPKAATMPMSDTSPVSKADIDPSLPTPLYHQIYLALKKHIRAGDYAFDSVLPGEKELCRLFDVSRITVKRALSELAAEGYVSRHRGRGTVVRFRTTSPIVRGNFDGLLENLIQMGVNTAIKLVMLEEVKAQGDVAEALEVEEGYALQHAVRLRSIEKEPFSYLNTYVPADLMGNITRADMESTPLLKLLAQQGIEVASARQTITAVGADAQIAQALDLSIGAPVLKISRVIKDVNLVPVQYIIAYYRPDRFEYEMKLTSFDGGFASFSGEKSS